MAEVSLPVDLQQTKRPEDPLHTPVIPRRAAFLPRTCMMTPAMTRETTLPLLPRLPAFLPLISRSRSSRGADGGNEAENSARASAALAVWVICSRATHLLRAEVGKTVRRGRLLGNGRDTRLRRRTQRRSNYGYPSPLWHGRTSSFALIPVKFGWGRWGRWGELSQHFILPYSCSSNESFMHTCIAPLHTSSPFGSVFGSLLELHRLRCYARLGLRWSARAARETDPVIYNFLAS